MGLGVDNATDHLPAEVAGAVQSLLEMVKKETGKDVLLRLVPEQLDCFKIEMPSGVESSVDFWSSLLPRFSYTDKHNFVWGFSGQKELGFVSFLSLYLVAYMRECSGRSKDERQLMFFQDGRISDSRHQSEDNYPNVPALSSITVRCQNQCCHDNFPLDEPVEGSHAKVHWQHVLAEQWVCPRGGVLPLC